VITSIGEYIISKAIVDRSKIPFEAYSKVAPLTKEFYEIGSALSKINTDEPFSWIEAVSKLSDRFIEKAPSGLQNDPLFEYLEDRGYVMISDPATDWYEEFLLRNTDMVVEIKDGDDYVASISLPGGVVYVMGDSKKDSRGKNPMVGKRFYYPEDEDARKKVYESIGDLVWRDKTGLFFDVDDEDYIVENYKARNNEYYGEGRAFADTWGKYVDAGVRRVVVLQGAPGTGKSTLCSYVARQINSRIVHASLNFIKNCHEGSWFRIMDVLKPNLVIVDDIDRIPTLSLERKLYMFEEGVYDVPLTIFTTNDDTKLPDAMRRPGRIDQIIDMPEPPRQGKISLIEGFARDVGIEGDIPKDKMDYLINVFEVVRSGAYVKELLKRYKVEGWDYELGVYDKSFWEVVENK